MTDKHTIHLSIAGMSCAGCVAAVEQALQAVPGVESASVIFAEHTATVTGEISAAVLVGAVLFAIFRPKEIPAPEKPQPVQVEAPRHAYGAETMRAYLKAKSGISGFFESTLKSGGGLC